MGIKKGTKYKLSEKAKRNRIIIDYKRNNPDATLRDMANIFSLSYVRIGQILKNGS